MTPLNTLVRSCYLSLQGFPGQREFGVVVYEIAARYFRFALQSRLRHHRGKLRCFQKGGMARGDLSPGISDIDFLIVFEDIPSREIVHAILSIRDHWFFRQLPLLGEVELVPGILRRHFEENFSRTSFSHQPIKDEGNVLHHFPHPDPLATALDAVFDYCFHFTCRFDDARRELASLQRAAMKIYRHFPQHTPMLTHGYIVTQRDLMAFLETVVSPFLGPSLLEATPEAYFIHEALGPSMVPNPDFSFYVCSPEAISPRRGAHGHPPIFATTRLRAFIYHFLNRERAGTLPFEFTRTWRELELLRTGTQCLGHAVNSYGPTDPQRRKKYFYCSLAQWVKLHSGPESLEDFGSIGELADYFDEFNSSTYEARR